MPDFYNAPGAAASNAIQQFMLQQKMQQHQDLMDRLKIQEEADYHQQAVAALEEKKAEGLAKLKEMDYNNTAKAVGSLSKGDHPDPRLVEKAKEHSIPLPMGVANPPAQPVPGIIQHLGGPTPTPGAIPGEMAYMGGTKERKIEAKAAADKAALDEKLKQAKELTEERAAAAKAAAEERAATAREAEKDRMENARMNRENAAAIAGANRTSREGIAGESNRTRLQISQERLKMQQKVEKLTPAQQAAFKTIAKRQIDAHTGLFATITGNSLDGDTELEIYNHAYEEAKSIGTGTAPAAGAATPGRPGFHIGDPVK